MCYAKLGSLPLTCPAGLPAAPPQVKYSQLMHGLKQENIQVNRKMLSELVSCFACMVCMAQLLVDCCAASSGLPCLGGVSCKDAAGERVRVLPLWCGWLSVAALQHK